MNATLRKEKPGYFSESIHDQRKIIIPANTTHLYNVDPTSSTLVEHCTNVILMFCVLLGLDILHIDQGCSILTGGYGTAVFGTRLTAHAPTSCIHEIALTL